MTLTIKKNDATFTINVPILAYTITKFNKNGKMMHEKVLILYVTNLLAYLLVNNKNNEKLSNDSSFRWKYDKYIRHQLKAQKKCNNVNPKITVVESEDLRVPRKQRINKFVFTLESIDLFLKFHQNFVLDSSVWNQVVSQSKDYDDHPNSTVEN